MPRALRVCSQPGCPELCAAGRCDSHRREADRVRGTAVERGYGTAHRVFRRAVLRRDPICVMPNCWRPSEHADHWPMSLRELRDAGLNPYEPSRGRGLCQPCHAKSTAKLQPGGWNAR